MVLLVWTGVVLAVATVVVVLGWRGGAGTTDPTAGPTAMSRTAVVLNSGILVFREGLECILVLAAVTASLLGSNRSYRKPITAGGAVGVVVSVATWFVVIWLIGMWGGTGLSVQAATGIPAIIVLLLVMNWFFHKIYWTGWISHHNKRRRKAVRASKRPSGGAEDGKTGDAAARSTVLGLALLGFTSVYREGFEIVIFLQGLRERYGSNVVLEGVILGLLFTAAVGILTFVLHSRLPYKKLLIITGGLLVVVLWVMVGEEINEMQLAGWIGTTTIPGLQVPGWAGQWFSVFPNVETFAAQALALILVGGSYLGAQYLRVWRPQRRGQRAATISQAPPEPAVEESR